MGNRLDIQLSSGYMELTENGTYHLPTLGPLRFITVSDIDNDLAYIDGFTIRAYGSNAIFVESFTDGAFSFAGSTFFLNGQAFATVTGQETNELKISFVNRLKDGGDNIGDLANIPAVLNHLYILLAKNDPEYPNYYTTSYGIDQHGNSYINSTTWANDWITYDVNGDGIHVQASNPYGPFTFQDNLYFLVNAVDDAPTFVDTTPRTSTRQEDTPTGVTVASLLGEISDLDDPVGGAGIAITGLTVDAGSSGFFAGFWQYSVDGGASWAGIPGSRTVTSAFALQPTDLVRYIGPQSQSGGSVSDNGGSGTLTFVVWERTTEVGRNFVNTLAVQSDPQYPSWTISNFGTQTMTFTATVASANDAPVIAVTTSTLISINEDNVTNTGQTVLSFIGTNPTQTANVTRDVDIGALRGIAITGHTDGNGHWEYRADASAAWTTLGAVSSSSAVLLSSANFIRFVPDAKNATSATLTYRAWDQTSGTPLQTGVNTSTNGGTTAFSTATATSTINVTAVNDASTATGLDQSFTIAEDGQTGAFHIVLADVDIGDTYLARLTVDPLSGSLSTSGGATYVPATGIWQISGNLATVNAALDAVKFTAAPNFAGTATIATHIEDGGALFPKNGSITVEVTAVQDAPVLAAASPVLVPLTEDDIGNAGQTVGSFASAAITDPDAGDPKGIAITGHTDGNGHWEYKLYDGGTWITLGSVSDATALLLRAEDFIRFVPNEKNGTSGTLTYRAWDQTSAEQAGEIAGTTVNGDASAFSIATNTASIAVSDVDDLAIVTTTPVVTTESKLPSFVFFNIASKVAITDVDAYDAAHPLKYVAGSGTVTFDGPPPPDETLADLLTLDPDTGTVLYDRSAFRWLTNDQHVTYTISFKVQSGDDAQQDTSLTVTINGLNDAPVLASPTHATFAAITEDDPASAARTVALFRGPVTDGDPGALTGIAITATNGNGDWQYSIDDGAHWTTFTGSAATALLLLDTDLVRFAPDGKNGGQASFTYRAWDQTAGTHGDTADATVTGGASAFSNVSDVVTLAVASINDAPVMTPDHMTLLPITEDEVANSGQPVWQFLCNAIGDVDTGAVQGIALTGTTNGNGHWEYSLDGGSTWASVGTVGEGAALLLKADDTMRFVPDGKNGTSATLTYHAWDQTSGTHGQSVDLTAAGATGGVTAYSILTDTVSIAVSDVNDAPVVSGPVTLAPSSEDTVRMITEAELLGHTSDVDAGHTLQVQDLVLVGNGNLVDNHDGTWTFTPAQDDDTGVSFTYTVGDGIAPAIATSATLDITPVNDAPVAQSGIASGDEDTAITGTVTAMDVDVPANSLTFALSGQNGGALHGTVSLDGATGNYIYTPDHDFFGTDSFGFKANDGHADSAAASVNITVNPVNDLPVITTATPLSVAENQTIVAALGATDVDGPNAASFTITGGVDAALFDIVGGNLVFRNPRDYETQAHSYQVEISAFDGIGATAKTITVNLTDVNDNAPLFTSNANAPDIIPENVAAQTVVYGAAASDADGSASSSTIVYALTGDDAALFSIDPAKGKVRFLKSPDYEAPKDQNHDNAYQLVIHANDGAHDVTQDLTITVTNINDAPVAASGSASGEQVITGQLAATDVDSASLTYSMATGPSHGTLTVKPDGAFSYAVDLGYRGADSFSFKANDGALDSNAATFDLNVTQLRLLGTAGNDSYTAVSGNERIDAGGGIDTISFGFKLTDATVTWVGNQVVIDTTSSHTVLTGFEVFKFADGTVNNADGNPLVDDLYYYSQYHDVWTAHADADQHYNNIGWHEGRDPSAFFDTSFYLSVYQDVRVAGVNPLTSYDQSGWLLGRAPSMAFDGAKYLKANPDVAAAHIDPLAHFLGMGAQEGRQPVALTQLIAANGFDYVYYLQHNPDVAAAGIDPFQHFETIGWKEGRNPNALFDTKGYLATYTDVKAAGINPLDHYDTMGWKEGRDPSVNFDTKHYLAAYPDIAAAKVDPLVQYLQFGQSEGRSTFADGHFG